MLDIRKRLILMATLFLSIPFLFGCFIDMKRVIEIASDNQEQLPVQSLRITIDESQHDELVSQLRRFSDKHDDEFEFLMSDSETVGFAVQLLGNHIEILATDAFYDPTLIEINLYDRTRTKPVTEETLQTMDDLVNELKGYINEIPNVTIAERIKTLKIRIDENQRKKIFDELLVQWQKLADEHSLEFKASSYDVDWGNFLFEMQGDGFRITVKAVLSPPRDTNIVFYIGFDNNVVPTITPTPQETFDELVNDFKSFINETPNVIIVEEE